MFKRIALLSWAIAFVLAAPPVDVVPLEKQQPTVIPIVSQSEELEANGTYKFSYETGNGIKREETAYEKVVPKLEGRSASSNEGGESDESDEIHVQRGSYSYTAPDGTVITVSYIADENGFQPIGDHIPRVPGIASASSHSSEKSGRALKNLDSVESASLIKESKVEAKSAPLDESKPTESISTASSAQSDGLKNPVSAPADIAADQKANPSATSQSNKLDEASETSSESAQTEPSVASEESKSTTNLESSSEPSSTEAVTEETNTSTSAILDNETPVSTAEPEQASTTIASGLSEAVEPSSTVSSSNDEAVSTEANNQSSTTDSVPLSTESEIQSTISDVSTTEGSSSTTVSP